MAPRASDDRTFGRDWHRVRAQYEHPAKLSTRAGAPAQVVDATRLPFGHDAFDLVGAMWMLYHVPDLDRTLSEIARVLRPAGTLLAATNGIEHTADLRALAGLPRAATQFMTESVTDRLRPHFTDIRVRRFAPVAELDHAGAVAYIGSFAPDAARRIEPFDGVRTFHGSSCVITAAA